MRMVNKECLEKHLALAKRIVKDTQVLTKEYKGQTPQQVVELLSAAIECDIPPEEMSVNGWQMIKLKRRYCSFEFDVVHNYGLTNKTTHQKLNDSKWYIHFGCGGCGRLNLCASSDYAYKAEAEDVWVIFLKRIQEYNPIDWDGVNNDYIFSVENGYKLYKDFGDIYKQAVNDMHRAIAVYKKAELEAEIKRLDERNANGQMPNL